VQKPFARPPNFNPLRFSLPPEPPQRERDTPEDRQSMIAKAAYLRAERRNFAPGHELEDWLAAETEVDRQLAAQRRRSQPSPTGG
jgi:hypothetical protein